MIPLIQDPEQAEVSVVETKAEPPVEGEVSLLREAARGTPARKRPSGSGGVWVKVDKRTHWSKLKGPSEIGHLSYGRI